MNEALLFIIIIGAIITKPGRALIKGLFSAALIIIGTIFVSFWMFLVVLLLIIAIIAIIALGLV
ncbi:hypothetical protein OAH55_02080 [Hellea sp.]|nr:hypothetical protein [Hellea sp.]MDB4844316.1 hypothetical protein [Hellea sp.]